MKCPECNAECWRDEHPDGIAASPYSCSQCGWTAYNSHKYFEDSEDINFELIPF